MVEDDLKNDIQRFVITSKSQHLGYGYESDTDRMFEDFCRDSPTLIGAFVRRVHLGFGKDVTVCQALLKALGYLDKSYEIPQVVCFVLFSLEQDSVKMREAALHVCDHWSPDYKLDKLETTVMREHWLEDYRKSVLKQFGE